MNCYRALGRRSTEQGKDDDGENKEEDCERDQRQCQHQDQDLNRTKTRRGKMEGTTTIRLFHFLSAGKWAGLTER